MYLVIYLVGGFRKVVCPEESKGFGEVDMTIPVLK
jgi:hypothetical protein